MRRRPGTADEPVAEQARAGLPHRAAMPWVTVAAGAGAVTLVLAAAGMVGAATGGGEAVVVEGVTADGSSGVESGLPDVTPRPDTPRPEVTRVPPPDDADSGTTPSRPPASSAPVAPTGPPTTTAPETAPDPTTTPSPTTPAPSPTTPAPTTDPEQESVSWVQERLRAHGATIEVTGTLDDATVAALRAFQQAHGLTADGSVTAATAEALAVAPGSGDDGSAGGTTPAEPTPTPSTDRPSTGTPGSTTGDPGASGTAAPTS